MTRAENLIDQFDADEIEQLDMLPKPQAPESRAADIVAANCLAGRYRFCRALGWLEWDGTRWDDDPSIEDRVIEAVRRYIDDTEKEQRANHARLTAEAAAAFGTVMARVPDADRTDAKGKPVADAALYDMHATPEEKEAADKRATGRDRAAIQRDMWLNLLSNAKISSLTRLCQRQDGILTRADEFDAHPDLLNATNGVVDLKTGALLAHDPDLLLTKIAGGAYIPGATSELWTQALEAIPADIREWTQTRFGQSITGHTPDDDALIVSAGQGENGKSALMVAIMRAAGSYGRLISHRVLLVQPGQHPTELMDLRGLRLALMEETPEEGRLDTHQLKTTVGTPEITARRMHKNTITFRTTHSMWVNTNHLPQVDTTDHGTWRRLKAMPFPYRFVKPGQPLANLDVDRPGDPRLKPRLAHADGVVEAVLAWAVAGAVRWYGNERVAPADPPMVVDETRQWRASCDVGLQFAQERLVADPGAFITGEVMRAEFTAFLRELGKAEWSAKTINTRLGASMAAAGITAQADPTKTTKVRLADVESKPAVVWGGNPARATKPGDKLRLWRGVRFKTDDDRARENDADRSLRVVSGGVL